ncbi:hypothetical protein [Floridanema evergladense]|uniref:Uncharacterized protein n=1 Tax=Floridaenema evergladense BLCC-F167 TaxID=3153639 RepID=A0ABV4WEK0_9CYAN
MPVAFTQEIIPQQWNAALLRSSITNKMIALGYLNESTSENDMYFSFDLPTAAPKDKGYLRINVSQPSGTSIKIQQWFSDAYTTNNLVNSVSSFSDTTGNSVSIGYGSNENFPIKFCTFKSPEIALLAVIRSDNNASNFNLGFVFPSVRPSWWDNNSLYGFCGAGNDYSILKSCIANQINNNSIDISYFLQSAPNVINPGGTRDLIRRIILSSCTGGIIVGATTTDIGIIGASGIPPLTQIQDSNQVWVNLKTNNSMAIRIV